MGSLIDRGLSDRLRPANLAVDIALGASYQLSRSSSLTAQLQFVFGLTNISRDSSQSLSTRQLGLLLGYQHTL